MLFGRRRSLEARAIRDVERSVEGRWTVRGPRPLIALVPDDGRPVTGGDIRLELEFSGAGAPERATLHTDTGAGLANGVESPLPSAESGVIEAVVTLPESAVGIGLEPGQLETFEFGRLRLTELSVVGGLLSHGIPQVKRLAGNPAELAVLLGRAVRLFRYRGLKGIVERLRRGTQRQLADEGYEGWTRRYVQLSDAQRKSLRARLEGFRAGPMFSLFVETEEASAASLRRTLDSFANQIYPHWQVCLAEARVPFALREVVEGCAPRERVRWASGTDASSVATGEFVIRLAAGDALAEEALFAMADTVTGRPELSLVYTDSDAEDATGETKPSFKPDWSPELLRSFNYLGRAAFIRLDGVRALGGWQAEAGDVPQHDLLLRCTEELRPDAITHVPAVLVHLRRERPQAAGEALAEIRVVQASLDRVHVDAKAEGGRAGTVHVRYGLPNPPPLVTVVIPTRDRLALLSECIRSVREVTAYPLLELLVVDNDSREAATRGFLRNLESKGVARVLSYPLPFNFSAMNNLAAREARGEVLCLLNNDVEAIESGWLAEMVGLALQPGVGAVGAKLLYPDDKIQHAGTVAGLFGVAAHAYLREPRHAEGYLLQLQTTREVAAVTAACMVLRRDTYLAVGGLDEAELAVAFNDVDLCFRLLRAGYRNLWTPYAELYHRESASRGNEERGEDRQRFLREESVMRARWGALIERDPYYSPNLSLDSNTPRPSWPPRFVPPWRATE
jgi:O-antigen biosynthesis protein